MVSNRPRVSNANSFHLQGAGQHGGGHSKSQEDYPKGTKCFICSEPGHAPEHVKQG